MSVKAVTVDAGGTLLYVWPSVGHVYSEVMEAHGLRHCRHQLDAAFAAAWREAHDIQRQGSGTSSEKNWWRTLVRRVLDDLGEPEDFDAMFEDLWIAFADPQRWRLYDDAVEFLSVLKARDYPVALLSNWDDRLRGLLEGLDLLPYFDHIFISAEIGHEKPHREIFAHVEASMGISGEGIIHIGDSHHHDYVGAQDAGWRCLLVEPDLEKDPDDGKIHGLKNLLDHL